MDKNSKRLDDVIEAKLGQISRLESGSDAEMKAVTSLSTLYKLRLEEAKLNAQVNSDSDKILIEQNRIAAEQEKAEAERINQIVDVAGRMAETLLKLGVGAGLFMIGLKFEENGTIGSFFVRNMSQKALPKL